MGEVEIVAVGPPIDTAVPLVVKNNTSKTVEFVKLRALAHDASGELLAESAGGRAMPVRVASGDLSLAYVFFEDIELPDGASFDFTMEVGEPSDDLLTTLRIVELAAVEMGFVGSVVNTHDWFVEGPTFLLGVGLDGSGSIVGFAAGTPDKEEFLPGETSYFDTTYYGEPCEHLLIAAMGYEGRMDFAPPVFAFHQGSHY